MSAATGLRRFARSDAGVLTAVAALDLLLHVATNGQYGFQGFGSRLTIDHNEVTGNNTDNWEARRASCGCTGGAKFWDVNGATITSNYVHGNRGPGLWADTNNRSFDVERNYIADNQGQGFIY